MLCKDGPLSPEASIQGTPLIGLIGLKRHSAAAALWGSRADTRSHADRKSVV